jgi:xylulokinase
MLSQLGLEMGPRIFITGGGSRSLLWSQIRASVMGRVLIRPLVTETALGAAMLAAVGCWYPTLQAAAVEMVRAAQIIEPEPVWQPVYEERFQAFQAELARRGYLG